MAKYQNYDSISVVNEEELVTRRDSRQRRLSVASVAVGVCLVAPPVLMLGFGLHLSPSHLLGPLLGPYLDGNEKHIVKAIKELQRLDKILDGSIVFMDNPAFCDAAHVWKEGLLPPLAVVEVASEADVQLAVPVLADIYLDRGVPFRVRSGGHSYGGFSTVEKGIVLSLSALNSLDFDGITGIATMGPAAKTQDLLDQILVPSGYGGVTGGSPGVAEGGFVLGGGFGFLSRKYGLGADCLVSARVVLRDGTVVVASDSEWPDLFWALRGAGQNMFGVVTQLEYQLHPSQDTQLFVSGQIPLDPAIMTAIGKSSLSAPGEYAFLLEGPIYKQGTTDGLITWFGTDDASLDVGETYIQENVLTLLPDDSSYDMSFDRLSWSKTTLEGGNFDGNFVRAWTGFLFEDNNTEEVWASIIKELTSVCVGNPYLIVDIELWGGEIANKDQTATAFAYRNAVFNVGLGLLVPADMKHAKRIFRDIANQVDRAWDHIEKHLEGVYTNYIVERLSAKDYARAYWGGNLEKLEQLKEKYDPNNVFHHPQSVPPSGKQQVASV